MNRIMERYRQRQNALETLEKAIKRVCEKCELRGKRPCPFRDISHDYCDDLVALYHAIEDAMTAQVNYWLEYEKEEDNEVKTSR